MKKENILCSACLLGENCRYDGGEKPDARVSALAEKYRLVPVCPEVLGGLGVPRSPSEIKDGHVFDKEGRDVTEFFVRGAMKALETAKENGCFAAVLKSKSPSCGCGRIYDGTFSGTLADGDGIFAALLKAGGFKVITEEDL